jgi:site-specific DNA recombinase
LACDFEARAVAATTLQLLPLGVVRDRSYIDEGGVRLIELANSASRLFRKQQPNEQRRLLNFVLSNSTWQNGELHPTFRQPFDLIAQATAETTLGKDGKSRIPSEQTAWLGN